MGEVSHSVPLVTPEDIAVASAACFVITLAVCAYLRMSFNEAIIRGVSAILFPTSILLLGAAFHAPLVTSLVPLNIYFAIAGAVCVYVSVSSVFAKMSPKGGHSAAKKNVTAIPRKKKAKTESEKIKRGRVR